MAAQFQSGLAPPVHIRPFRLADAPAAQTLLRQLGAEIGDTELHARIGHVLGQRDHYLAVAEDCERVVGLLHVFRRPALEKPCEAVVQALVVEPQARGRGIGRALMDAAEAWARAGHLPSVALSTQRAGDFYGRLGYSRVATSDLMRKSIGARQ